MKSDKLIVMSMLIIMNFQCTNPEDPTSGYNSYSPGTPYSYITSIKVKYENGKPCYLATIVFEEPFFFSPDSNGIMHVWSCEYLKEITPSATITKEVKITRGAWGIVMWQGELEMSFYAQGSQVAVWLPSSEWPKSSREIIISDKYAKIIP